MKLDKSHVGKKIRSQNGLVGGVLIGFDGELMVLKLKNGSYEGGFVPESATNPWELVEEPKKPSQRIKEIYSDLEPFPHSLTIHDIHDRFRAVVDFLDEEWGKRK